MTAAPDSNSSCDEPIEESPRWLGSAARRGLATASGSGWTERNEEDGEHPRWLGSVARRGGSQATGTGWVEPEHADGRRWLGSAARRGDRVQVTESAGAREGSSNSLYLIDLDAKNEPGAAEEVAALTTVSWEGSGARAGHDEVSPPPAEEDGSPAPEPETEPKDERPEKYVVGELGMRIRVAA
jgi:hypothetical protein